MRISTYALATAIAGIAVSVPAMAQYGGRQEQTTIRSQSGAASSKSEEEAKAKAEADKLSSGRKVELSKEARKAII